MVLIIKYRSDFISASDIHGWTWAQVDAHTTETGLSTKYTKIPEERATALITEFGLDCVASDSTMHIYDTPERDFQKKYKGNIRVKELPR